MPVVPDGSPDFDVALAFGSPTRVFVAGEVDIATAPVLDLSAVTFLDASGIRVLAATAQDLPVGVAAARGLA